MTARHQHLADLIDDARLVIAYATRVGELRGPGLAESVSTVEAGMASGGPSPAEYAAFMQNLNTEINAIAPVTLIDLGSRWKPFPTSLEYKWFNRILIVFGVLLIATVAFYTQFFTIANETLGTLRTVQYAEAEEKLDRLKLLLRDYPVLVAEAGAPKISPTQAGMGGPDLPAARAVLSSYVKELRIINENIMQVEAKIFDLTNEDALYPPWFLSAYHGFGVIWEWIVSAVPPIGGAIRPVSGSTSGAAYPSQEEFFAKSPTRAEIQNDAQNLEDVDPAKIYKFTALFSIQSFDDRNSVLVESFRKSVFVLGNWVLPALYGLVGSIVFQMRRVLSPMQPSLPPVRLLFRIALGGFAGIIVTWFWTPSIERVSAGESISITAFGIAFLVGYSSEIFFVLLDNAVNYLMKLVRHQTKATA